MIGDHAMACRCVTLGLGAHDVFNGRNEVAEQVRLEDALNALEDAGHAFQAHARIDRRTRQRRALARRCLVELHEDEVPEFQEAVAVFLRRTGRTAPDMLALIDEDLRAGTTGTSIAHLPEIVGSRDADDLVVREAGDLLPERRSLLVIGIDGHEQTVLRQIEPLGDRFQASSIARSLK